MTQYKGIVLVAPGGPFQHPLVRKLQDIGFVVHVADIDPKSYCCNKADFFHNVSSTDIEALDAICKKYNVDFALTDQTDTSVYTINQLNIRLRKKVSKPKTIETFCNKLLLSKKAASLNHLVPETYEARKFFNSERTDKKCNWIVKPVDSQSSKGISILNANPQNNSYLEEAITFSESYSKCGQAIIQQYITGTEYTVEGIVENGDHRVLAISRKYKYKTSPFVSSRLDFAAPEYWGVEFENLIRRHNKFINSAELINAQTHAEYIHYNGQFYMIECAARGGGSLISSHIVPFVSGVNPEILLAAQILDKELISNTYKMASSNLVSLVFCDPKIPFITLSLTRRLKTRCDLLYIQPCLQTIDSPAYSMRSDEHRNKAGFLIVTGSSIPEINASIDEIRLISSGHP